MRGFIVDARDTGERRKYPTMKARVPPLRRLALLALAASVMALGVAARVQAGDKAGEARAASTSVPGTTVEMEMRKYVIERELPAVGSLGREELKAAAQKSNAALKQLGPDIQWVESYVAGDKTFCVYLAKDEEVIRRHAEISGFPASRITEIKRMIDPTTAAQ